MRSVSLARSDTAPVRAADAARSMHMHVLGVSGQGKSFFLEHLIRQDIRAGNGVCVIDPHGELYENLVAWVLSEGIDRIKTVHLLNPSNERWTFGFNPLCVENGISLAARVDAMVDACVKVWGGADINQTPRLAKCLTATFHALAHHRLSLAEARYLTNAHLRAVAQELTDQLENDEYRELWRELLTIHNEKTFAEYFESTTSRLIRFVGDPVIKDIVGQTENVINFRTCMDRGEIVLVNLSPKGAISPQSAQLIGALITNDLYRTAFGRDQRIAKERPFYCYVDECAQFLTDDIVQSLDETRKFGLHMVLSHQRLEQLRKYGENFFNAVMANSQTKVVFRVGDQDTAEIMSKHLFRPLFDLEIPKHSMDKPTVVDHEVIELEGRSETHSEIRGQNEGSGFGQSVMSSISQLHAGLGEAVGGFTQIAGEGETSFGSQTSFEAHGRSVSRSTTETLRPVLEWLPTQLHTLEELVHLGMQQLLTLPKRSAYVVGPNLPLNRVTTFDVKTQRMSDPAHDRGVNFLNFRSPVTTERSVVREQAETRRTEIEHRHSEPVEDDGLGY